MLGPLTPTIRLTDLLGEGAFGVVYKGHIEGIERVIAVKILNHSIATNKDFVRRFFNEAKATNRIRHNGIVQITEVGQSPDGRLYLVMEFLEGETLRNRISRNSLSITDSVRFGCQLTNALYHAHQQGVVHRDLKPDNIMIVSDTDIPGGERVKILDFGIARVAPSILPATPDAQTHQQTAANVIMGTPSYMAPEQWNGAKYTDSSSDIYSLGVILYQMLTGRLPFEAPSTTELMMLHVSAEPEALRQLVPQIPVELAILVHRMLAKKSPARPTTEEVWQTLQAQLGRLASPPSAGGVGSHSYVTADLTPKEYPPGPAVRPTSRHFGTAGRIGPGKLALGLIIGVVTVLAAAVGIRSRAATPRTVQIHVDTDPSGMEFELRDQATDAAIGLTPITQTVQIDSRQEYRWYVRKAGYKSVKFVVKPRADLNVVLPISAIAPVVTPPKTPPGKPDGEYDPFPN